MTVVRMRSGAAVLLLLGAVACSTETVAPPVQEVDIAGFDPSLGAVAGQAGFPGLTMNLAHDVVSATDGCQWDAAVARVVCAPVTRNGLTVRRSFVFLDGDATPQPRRDESTVAMNTRIAVAGSIATDRGTVTVDRGSTLTVSGLARGSSGRTLNGEESGTTTGTRRTDRGTVTTVETFQARTDDVVIPVPRPATAWPLSGSSTRRSSVTASREGTTETRTRTFGHQVTFNGTRYVPITMTSDGTARQCTLDLALHRIDCGR